MQQDVINYSQCWEDAELLLEAFALNNEDTVLSITSGGDNSLALLGAGPKHLVSIDLNKVQNYVLEFKFSAAQALNYHEYLQLLGVTPSHDRQVLFQKVEHLVTPDAKQWWGGHRDLIERGVVHVGRFERFSATFAKRVLPLVHSKKTVEHLLSLTSVEEQKGFYRERWDTWRWRLLFGLASSRVMLKNFARQRGMFAHAQESVAHVYRKRLERHLTSVSIANNYFLHYSLTGEYGKDLPPYLREDVYKKLHATAPSSLTVVTENLVEYLKKSPDNTFSKFNLSDVFEALSEAQSNELWVEIVRTAKGGAVVAFWNNLVERTFPPELTKNLVTNVGHMRELRAKDKVFFYGSFQVHTIRK
jgi:S-adenosylmethionine-diacylglycerol 3-amino-3-carboxypropyl transferase